MLSLRFSDDGTAALELSATQLAAKRSVERNVRDGVYSFERVPCAVCGGEDFETLAGKDRCGLSTAVVICNGCGLVQTNPRMTAEAYRRFYNDEYRLLQYRESTPREAFARERRRGRRIAEYLARIRCLPAAPTEAFVLEVGCGAGGILAAFRDLGFDVQGLDVAVDLLAYGRECHGLDLVATTLGEIELRRRPNIVIYSHVVEHILDVGAELDRLREVLAPGGLAYLEVPGIKRLDAGYEYDFLRYLQNAHCYHFRLATLTNLIACHGFERVAGDELVRSVFQVGDRPETNLSAWQDDRASVLLALREAERRRQTFHPKAALRRTLQRAGLIPWARRVVRWLRRLRDE
jgi:SAM-dependent methyltransferase